MDEQRSRLRSAGFCVIIHVFADSLGVLPVGVARWRETCRNMTREERWHKHCCPARQICTCLSVIIKHLESFFFFLILGLKWNGSRFVRRRGCGWGCVHKQVEKGWEKKPSEGVVWSQRDFTWANAVQGKEQWTLSSVKLNCEDWKVSRTLLSTQSALLRNGESNRGEKKSVSTPVSAEMEGTAHFSSASSGEDNLASSDEQILLKTRYFFCQCHQVKPSSKRQQRNNQQIC